MCRERRRVLDSRSLVFLLAALAASGCASSRVLRDDFYTAPPAAAAPVLRVALLDPPADKSTLVSRETGYRFKIALQPALSEAMAAAGASAGQVHWVNDPKDAAGDDVLVSLVPTFPDSTGFVVKHVRSGQTIATVGAAPLSAPLHQWVSVAAGEQRMLWYMLWCPVIWFLEPTFASDYANAAYRTVAEPLDQSLESLSYLLRQDGVALRDYDKIMPRYRETVQKADQAFQAGRMEEALQLYAAAMREPLVGPEKAQQAALSDRCLEAVARAKRLPGVPEEARTHAERAQAQVKMAESDSDYAAAIQEMRQAIAVAPWWAGAYFNAGLIEEAAKRYGDAVNDLNKYLRVAPASANAKAVREKIYELEIARDRTPQDRGQSVRRRLLKRAMKRRTVTNGGDVFTNVATDGDQ